MDPIVPWIQMAFAALYTIQNIDSTTFYPHSSDSVVFLTHRIDGCGFLEIDACSANSLENWQNAPFLQASFLQ